MAQNNQIAVEIQPAEMTVIQNKVAELKSILAAYGTTLTAEERTNMLKLGDKSIAFVKKVQDYCVSNPEFVPPFLSVPDMNVDINALDQLLPIYRSLLELTVSLEDAIMLSGNEAFTAALMYYNSVKLADKNGQPAAKLVYNELQERFPGRKGKVLNKPTP